jgi:hypothetical protein
MTETSSCNNHTNISSVGVLKLEWLLPGKLLGTRHCRLETASGSPSWPDGGLKCEWNDRTPDTAMKADRPGVLLLEDRKLTSRRKKSVLATTYMTHELESKLWRRD